ncbi:DUF4178 domain-containing protein [Pseudenhygromyxa sp. WMMC2535]|uniref:DUF4178 domain-containing protein n=1 Tax=Pseudenhygromyxa sp. WMMC2535 TaxID=2712867 RepID=UPI0015560EB6|nr:DUF4178 domain-containing protein [Pseudenhygromyxa sp. WMMC2535]NVB36929.1 DUF4178 domain-containing protein [Pseudenhygromyxa sp. WMMC2535]
MFIPSLLAAMTIAGAFWVGVLAARRLRDWGDSNRALDAGEAQLALPAGPSGGAPSTNPSVKKVRDRVAERLQASLASGQGMAAAAADAPRSAEDLDIDGLRVGDVVLIEASDARVEGDYVVEGLLRLREGGATTVVVVMADGGRRRWLIGGRELEDWFVVEPVEGHGLAGEPPRNIQPRTEPPRVYGLSRRGQASVAAIGGHGRPAGSRVGTYVYRAGARDLLWLERWGSTVLMGEGLILARHAVSFLPGS